MPEDSTDYETSCIKQLSRDGFITDETAVLDATLAKGNDGRERMTTAVEGLILKLGSAETANL
jgi:hypothetical protein